MQKSGDNQDFFRAAYEYALPPELIAQEPPARRGASRLMLLDRESGATQSRRFDELPELLRPGLIVVNNTRVLPARVMGRRDSGGKVEFLLLTPLPLIRALPRTETRAAMGVNEENGETSAEVACLLRSSKQVKIGETVSLGPALSFTLLERAEFGRCTVSLTWRGSLEERLATLGSLPLPPYIRRPADAADADRYQTLFARDEKNGSVAAPTAGLHFTPELKDGLTRAGHEWAEVTLYVGYGTFSPVRALDIREHPMHSEYMELSGSAAAAITAAKENGRPVIAVGTTAMRVLEGVHAALGRIAPFSGWTDIFLYPGKPVSVVDQLITNFHLPGSTLLMLVAALAGREPVLRAYERAIEERYRFFSYGDAMLIR